MGALKEQNELYSLFDSLGVGVMVLDAKNLQIQYLNREMEGLSLHKSGDLLGSSFLDLFSSRSRDNVNEFLKLSPIESDTLLSERKALLKRRSGSSIHVSLFMKNIADTSLKIITVINNEPRRELENELEKAYQQMIHTSKFLSLAEMAAGIAHEINNPLAIIHTYSEQIQISLKNGTLSDEKVLALSQKIKNSAMRAAKIIDSLKTLARNEPEQSMSNQSVKEIVENSVELLTSRFRRASVELVIGPISDDLEALCNQSQILQVILNLFENALHAVKNREDATVELNTKVVGDMIQISVKDNGPGVPVKIQNDIMHPFFTTKEAGEGTGLGLSISKNIIQNHNGKLEYKNIEDGALFSFSIPLYKPSEKSQKRKVVELRVQPETPVNLSSTIASFTPSHFTVLLVDDEPDIVAGTEFALKNRGYQVLTAHNGEEAMQVLHNNEVDVVVSDIRMPVITGFQMVEEIKKELTYFPKIFFMTGSTNVPVDKYFAAGVEGFFYKPVSIFDILSSLENSLLPPEKYLRRIKPRLSFDNTFHLKTDSSNSDQQLFNIGRGGMFVADQNELPRVNDMIEFSISFEHQSKTLNVSGTGIVRWVRSTDSNFGPRGFGVEFYSFEKEGAQGFFEHLDSLAPDLFIPTK